MPSRWQTECSTDFTPVKHSRGSSLPNVCVHPTGDAIASVGKGELIYRNISSDERFTYSPALRGNSYKRCAISPNGFLMAVVARHSSAVELIVTQIRHSVNSYQLENHYVLCHKHCITFKSDRLHRDRYNCRFSLDSSYVGVSSWNGHLLIFDVRLNLKCVVCPGLIDRLEDHMANERCFDFDYRFLNRRIAVGTANRCVYLCNIQSNSVVRKRRLGVSASCTHSTVGIQSEIFASWTRVSCGNFRWHYSSTRSRFAAKHSHFGWHCSW